ncbi:hypothetical protein [Stenotrophomonas sp.]|uniref:hypothetical protein n=1 Tax=Stenotrophomonas sp. TaxID=69392 RepID=UPI002FCBC915
MGRLLKAICLDISTNHIGTVKASSGPGLCSEVAQALHFPCFRVLELAQRLKVDLSCSRLSRQ